MVADWWRSAREGEDALMVAQRNVEVERLNATARELMRAEWRLGAEEIEVGRRALRCRRSGHHPRQRQSCRDLQPRALAGRRGERGEAKRRLGGDRPGQARRGRAGVPGPHQPLRRRSRPAARLRGHLEGLELREEARREAGAIREVLAQREELALTAIRLSPPRYIIKELGERPSDLEKGRAWDRGVKEIEGYRQGHGVTDKRRAFGREPQSLSQQAARETAQRNVREAQRRLGRERQLARERKLRRSIERGLSLGR